MFIPYDHKPLGFYFKTGFFGKQILMVNECGKKIHIGPVCPVTTHNQFRERKASEQEADWFMDRYNRKLGKQTEHDKEFDKKYPKSSKRD